MLPYQRLALETTGAAQACVELLWRENLGVATFMILVPISYYRPNSYFNVLSIRKTLSTYKLEFWVPERPCLLISWKVGWFICLILGSRKLDWKFSELVTHSLNLLGRKLAESLCMSLISPVVDHSNLKLWQYRLFPLNLLAGFEIVRRDNVENKANLYIL